MKTKSLLKSAFVMMAAMMLASCSQDDVLTNTNDAEGTQALTVKATDGGFIDVDNRAGSRVTENDATTKFDEGDAMGIFIVKDGKAIKSNIKLTYNANGSWDGDVYYYKDADYIAYFPYTEGVEATTVAGIKDTYAKLNPVTTNQTTAEAYHKLDLMTAEVKSANVVKNEAITFNFAHANSMMEFVVPTYSFTNANGLKYRVPENGFKLTIGKTEYKPWMRSTGVYRMIVPAETSTNGLSGEFTEIAIDKPVEFTVNEKTLKAGESMTYTVTYQNGGTTIKNSDVANKERALKIGDYYCADGTIIPGEFIGTFTDTKDVIGIVFSTTTNNEKAKDGQTDCTNGYVIGLSDIKRESYKWSWTDENRPNLTTVEQSGLANDKDGLANTNALFANETANTAIKAAMGDYNTKNGTPQTATEWFIPSAGQFIDMVNNLGETKNSDNNVFSGSEIKGDNVLACINTMQSKFAALGSYFMNGKDYWTSTMGTNCVWQFRVFASYSSVTMKLDTDLNTGHNIRPMFAF